MVDCSMYSMYPQSRSDIHFQTLVEAFPPRPVKPIPDAAFTHSDDRFQAIAASADTHASCAYVQAFPCVLSIIKIDTYQFRLADYNQPVHA